MPDNAGLLSQFYFTIAGSEPPRQLITDLVEVRVESSLHLPDVATLTFNDPRLRWIDEELLSPGKALLISARGGRDERPLFDGEIVELEPEFDASNHRLVVRAFDRLHRLARGQHVRSFQNVTDGELVRKLAQEVGLQAEVGPTERQHPYVLQANQTNLSFLQERAASLGYLLFVTGKTLHCEAPKPAGAPIELQWGMSLGEFRPRLSTIGQISAAIARGWDPDTRQSIERETTKGVGAPEISERRSGAALAEEAFQITARALVADRPIRTQEEAAQLAQAAADRAAQRYVVAEGVCGGNPAIIAGAAVKIKAVGDRFGGTYYVTSASHVYNADEGYTTEFSVSGLHPATLLSVLSGAAQSALAHSLAIGVVTDNADPDGLCRVKVKFPWLSADHTSDWVRVVVPGGGAARGVLFLPEIDDEVFVAFELGDIHHPVVLGGLWNGVDRPPASNDELREGDGVRKRVIQSRAGHTITLDDGEQGGLILADQAGNTIALASHNDGGITITDKAGNSIALASGDNSLAITVKGDVTLKSSGKMLIEAAGELTLKGASIQLNP